MLGIFFFGDAVDMNIHKESKNKITTQFAVKVREFNSPIWYYWGYSTVGSALAWHARGQGFDSP